MLTTDYFQCYDARMVPGPNIVALHGLEAGGETAPTVEAFTLNYSNATAPAVSIISPDGTTPVSGTNFTLLAQGDDDTATVLARITDTNGNTASIQGLVERDGPDMGQYPCRYVQSIGFEVALLLMSCLETARRYPGASQTGLIVWIRLILILKHFRSGAATFTTGNGRRPVLASFRI